MDGPLANDIEASKAMEASDEQQNNFSDETQLDGASSDVSEYVSHQMILHVDHDESDGQRRSLSLDDDGGAYFDNSQNLETVVRRGESAWTNETQGGPVFEELNGDNDVLFNPAQKLNFDETEEEDEEEKEFGGAEDEEVDDIRDEEILAEEEDNSDSLDGSNYLHHRPRVNGSDLVEDGAVAAITAANVNLIPDQGQNIRIIEGHDSSLLDDGNLTGATNAFNFNNFMQTQVVHLPSIPSLPSGRSDNNSDEDDGQNLYDSLDPEDGTSPYGHMNQVLDPNTSEYYSGGSMSLQTLNSQSQSNGDSFWPQEDVPHLRGSSNQSNSFQAESQNFVGNFQQSVFQFGKGAKEGHGPADDGSCAATSSMPNLQDGFELCEEGLLQGTQMYAQPVTNPGQSYVESSGNTALVNTTTSPKSGVGFSVHHSKLPGQSGDYLARGAAVQPVVPSDRENKMLDLALAKDCGGSEIIMDQRQAAAGSSSSSTNQNQSAKPKVRPESVQRKRATAAKTQTRRPAVQGSASSELVFPNPANSRSATATASATGKAIHQPSTNKPVRVSAQGGDSITKNPKPGLANDGSRLVGNASDAAMKSSPKYSRQYHASSPIAPRASSFAALSSLSGTNSRVSGVGKESHYYQRGPNASLSQGFDNQPPSTSNSKQDTNSLQALSGHHSQSAPIPNSHAPVQLAADHNLPIRSSSHNVIMSSQSHQQHVNRYPSHDSMVATSHSQHRTAHPSHDSMVATSHSQHRTAHPSMVESHPLQYQHAHHHLHQPHHPQILPQQQQLLQSGQSTSNHQLVSPTGSDQSHQSYNREMVVTQVDSMQRQPGRIPHHSENMDPASASGEQFEIAVPGMEDVRGHLHSMLNMAVDYSTNELDHTDTATELLLSNQPVNRQLHFDLDSSSFNGNGGPDDMSEILENFPTFSSKMFTEMSSMAHRTDTQTQGENQYLRDNLEKERYRRKHCEQQIQKLNAKLLETQQQLAVAVSTDKRKDLMIEQLDKQLAKVVEGWKKRESDKDSMLRTMKEEKEHVEECLQRQQTMINNFEYDLAQTVAELKEEKEKSSETIEHLRSEVAEAKQMKEEAEMSLAATADKCDKMSAQWNSLTEFKDNAEKLAQQAQDALIREENNWKEKESDLVNKISQVKEANQKVINMEKVKLEEEKKKREEIESEANQLKSELKKLVLDAEQLVREKESQKVEMSIMEAKFESAQRKLEADLHAEMEKEIANQAKEYHSKLESCMEGAGERHRKQVTELHGHHQRDLERQMASAGDEMKKKDDEHKRRISDYEEKLAENRNEISNLKQSKLKLESQRMEILSKLQFMMQSQWNEAVSLLVSTPQKKGLSNSFLSSQSGVMAGMPPPADGNGDMSLASSLNLASLVMTSSSQQAPARSLTPEKNNSSGRGGSGVVENKVVVKSCSNSNSVSSRSQTSEHHSSWKERESVCEEEKTRMDRVEEYVFRMAIQDNNPVSAPPTTNSQQPHHPISSQGPVTAASQGSNNMISAVVHHTAIPSEFQATAIKSPKQMSSRFWNDLGLTVNQEMGSHAPPPSIVSSSTSQNQDSRFNHSTMESDDSQDPHHQRNMHQHLSHQPHQHQPQQHHEQRQQQQRRPKEMVLQRHLSEPDRLYDGVGDHGAHTKDLGLPRPFFNSDIPTNMTSSPSSIDPRTMPTSLDQPNHNWSSSGYSVNSPHRGQHRGPKGTSLNSSGGDLLTQALSPPVKQSAMSREDLDENISDTSSQLPDPTRLQANYSHLSEQVDAHVNRQEELQHYIQMLLQKVPGSVASEPERDVVPNDSILESSRDLTVDLDLTETAQALEVTNQLVRLQELRERQQHMRHVDGMMPPPMTTADSVSQNASLSEMMLGQNGVLSSQNLAEISQLLSLYREQWEVSPESANQANTAGQLIDALRKGVFRPKHPDTKTSHDKAVPSTKDSPRGHHQASAKKGKGARDKVNKTKWKVGYQSADSSLNGGSDNASGTHQPNAKASQGGLAPHHHTSSKKGKSSAGSKVWK